jgi:NAD(P)-dependent dehydrogenase (short-subunit alcohol dehydrogenase family)
MELKQFGISVVVVQPGFVGTEIDVTRHMATNGGAVADYATLERELTAYLEAQTKAAVTPEVVAACVARASLTRRPKARYVTPKRNALVLGMLTTLPTRLTDRIKLRLVRSSGSS